MATLLIVFLAASSRTASAAGPDAFTLALSALDQGRERQATKLLESIDRGDPNFVEALEELQKLHYKNADWQRFFGYALYYRKSVLGAKGGGVHFSERLLSLELLALAKHCRFTEAQRIATGAIAFAAEHKLGAASELEATIKRLGLVRQYPRAVKTRERLERPPPVFASRLLWSLDSDKLGSIDNPRALRVLVASRCGK